MRHFTNAFSTGPLAEFAKAHAHLFTGGQGSEHSLRWSELHADYEQVMDGVLEAFLASEGVAAHEFAALLRPHVEAEDARPGGGASPLEVRARAVIELVVRAGDYETFVESMRTRRLLELAAETPLPPAIQWGLKT